MSKKSAFERFADRAAYYFGINAREAANLLDELEEEGFEWGRNRLGNSHWGERASELLDRVVDFPFAGRSEFWLEDEYDEWLESGEQYELTGEYEDTEP